MYSFPNNDPSIVSPFGSHVDDKGILELDAKEMTEGLQKIYCYVISHTTNIHLRHVKEIDALLVISKLTFKP